MAATYDPAMPTSRDKVRFLIQDTIVASAMLQDEEIDFMLTEYANYKMAAANCADIISSKYASAADSRSIGNLSLSYNDRSKKYADLANRLRTQASKSITPYAGGISKADKEVVADDTDRVEPAFKRGLQKQQIPTDITSEDEV